MDESRSRAFLKGGDYAAAERAARSAAEALEAGGEQSLLAEALTSHGVALARLGERRRALATLRRAEDVARQAGDRSAAGRATLAVLEELADELSSEEACAAFERASENLVGARRQHLLTRLNSCAVPIMRRLATGGWPATPPTWRGFSLKEAVRRYEGELIRRALEETEGGVSRAAQLLGLKSHQNLVHTINSRHRELLASRTPVIRRRRGVMRCSGERRPKK